MMMTNMITDLVRFSWTKIFTGVLILEVFIGSMSAN